MNTVYFVCRNRYMGFPDGDYYVVTVSGDDEIESFRQDNDHICEEFNDLDSANAYVNYYNDY